MISPIFRIFACALILIGTLILSAPTHAMPPGFSTEVLVSGLQVPTAVAFTPDGRTFIAEKGGTVRIVKNGALLPTPFITLTDVNQVADHGLLGLAIDPNFATNGFVYLSYTFENTPGANFNGPKTGRVVRVKASGDTADMSTYKILVGSVGGDAARPSCSDFATSSDCIPSDSPSHSVGALRFGPDGKLYASIGDGAGFFAVDERARLSLDLDSSAGKMLRLNTDGTGPADNPFYNGDPNANRSKIYFYGIRNSIRFGFRPTNNTLYFGDVGWYTWEEINLGYPGANYGWPCREGNEAQAEYNCTTTNYVDPIFTILHQDNAPTAIIGGTFASSKYPAEYQGNYFFGNFGTSLLYRMVLNPNDTVVSTEIFTNDARGPVEIVTAPDGFINYLSIYTGELRRLHYSATSTPTPTSTPPNTEIPENAWRAEYFNNIALSGSAATTTIVPNIQFDWGEQAPIANVNPDNFSARYTGRFNFSEGRYRFTAAGDDGYRLFIDNALVLDAWRDQSTTTSTVDLDITGSIHTIRFEYYDKTWFASAKLNWEKYTPPPITNVAPFHVTTTVVSEIPGTSPVVGELATVNTVIGNRGTNDPFIVDIEIFNASGTKVAQQIIDPATIPTNGQKTFELKWLAEQPGTYRVTVGLVQPEWASIIEWTNEAAVFTVLNRRPVDSGPFNINQGPTEIVSPAVVGQQTTVNTTISNTGGPGSAVIDFEFFDQTGSRVGQQYLENINFATNESKTVSIPWTPQKIGPHRVAIGLFANDWSKLFHWENSAATTMVTDGTNAGLIVYDDALAPGWENWSWETTVDFGATPGYQSTSSMNISFKSAWAGLYIHHAPLDLNNKTNLKFMIYSNNPGAQELNILLFDQNNQALTPVVIENDLAGVWQQVSIPLAELKGNAQKISGLAIQGSNSATFKLDNIVFE